MKTVSSPDGVDILFPETRLFVAKKEWSGEVNSFFCATKSVETGKDGNGQPEKLSKESKSKF